VENPTSKVKTSGPGSKYDNEEEFADDEGSNR